MAPEFSFYLNAVCGYLKFVRKDDSNLVNTYVVFSSQGFIILIFEWIESDLIAFAFV